MSTAFTPIDLSKLPPPDVIEEVDFETILAEMKAYAIAVTPELEPFLELESEPATKVLQVCAYFRANDLARFNDGARANMLALSTGTNLDGLGAYWGIKRLVVQSANDDVDPPLPEILEADNVFRRRIQLSLEGHSTAGPRGSYIFWASSVSGLIKDVSVVSPAPGEVLVTVLTQTGNGVPDQALIDLVEETLNHEDVRPLTDLVSAQPATIVTYTVNASIKVSPGPDPSLVLSAAKAAVDAYIENRHALGRNVVLSGLYAALHQPEVQSVTLISPAADIVVSENEAAFCTATPVVTLEE